MTQFSSESDRKPDVTAGFVKRKRSEKTWQFPAWICLILYSAIIYLISDRPIEIKLPKGQHFDKVLHFGAYFVWGSLATLSLWGTWRHWGKVQVIVVATILGSLYGISDEFHQSFVKGRSADFLDFVADSLGALAGAYCLGFIMEWWRGRENL